MLGAVPAGAASATSKAATTATAGSRSNLTSGIELRFGDASQAARKWKAAAAVLADPAITALDYVDLQAPSRPSIGGEGHILPTGAVEG